MNALQKNLTALFYPKTVAVVGASEKPGKIGNAVVLNMLQAGFPHALFPVNPKAQKIEGLDVVHSISELPSDLDLAVLTVPRVAVIPSLQELAAIRTRSVIIITAGFKEVDKEGYELEQQIITLCAKHDIALVGPNCLGMINTDSAVNASFASGRPQKGKIAFFSQSGALCTAILDWALGENIGFSKFISLGNKAVLSEAHMLEYLAQDEESKVVLGYIENVEQGELFLEQAAKTSRKKPVIMVKSGTTAAGAKAASSHTGAIAGSDAAYDAAFRKTGIIRVEDVGSLFDFAQAFSSQALPKGPNLAIVTNSGGPGIMAADATEKSKLNMARLEVGTIEKLRSVLPPFAALYNPIDLIGDAPAIRYKDALDIILKDNMVHSILVLLTPTAAAEIEETAQAIIHATRKTTKPVFACFMGKMRVDHGRKLLQAAGIPCYAFPESAINSIEAMFLYAHWKNKGLPEFTKITGDTQGVRKLFNTVRATGTTEVVEFQAQEVLRAYNLPTPNTILARSSEEAVAAAKKIGYPVVLKIASAQISHKSDVGGVKVNLQNQEDVQSNFWDITNRALRLRPDAHIAGCLVQEMAPKGVKEIIVGFKRDEQFGPLLMFGLGGIYVEILKDISFRLAPLSREDAREMIREIKTYMLLKGVRGEAAVNFNALEHILLAMSQLAIDFPEIYEAEFNPVLVNDKQAIVADVRMTLSS